MSNQGIFYTPTDGSTPTGVFADAAGSPARVAAVEGYMRNRETLVARMCEATKSAMWEGYSNGMTDLKAEIARIDAAVGGLLALNNFPEPCSHEC